MIASLHPERGIALSHRAPHPDQRTGRGLARRWLFWTVVLVGLGYWPATLAVRLVQLLLAD
ncbi:MULTISPECIES: hypothetical protein [unclassified Knoellia]|uniref:hypothetical protein n=1 Tax=Knoellia altitudinis TaxID=3404795 RepID=UPI0036176D6E